MAEPVAISCCAPASEEAASGCCVPEAKGAEDEKLHSDLAALLRTYNVNDYAASVKVFAVKP